MSETLRQTLMQVAPDIPTAVLDWAERRDTQLARLEQFLGDARARGDEGAPGPLGAKPRRIHDEHRALVLIAAMFRSAMCSEEGAEDLDCKLILPWAEELVDIARSHAK